MVHKQRIRHLNTKALGSGPVIYWMSRDQRVHDNWALLYAQELAMERKVPLVVLFCLQKEFLGATLRQYDFMLAGLEHVEHDLRNKQIGFEVMLGDPEDDVVNFVQKKKAAAVVCDFSPLRIGRNWRESVAKKLPMFMAEVDAHNIVPCWHASPKQEFGAYTFRPKIQKLLPEFLEDFSALKKHPYPLETKAVAWNTLKKNIAADAHVLPVAWIRPGEREARMALKKFIEKGLNVYDAERNDPTKDGQSNLSPYLHFGQLSAQYVALELQSHFGKAAESFLEELIVRRELSDNFCFYNPHYDSPEGFPDWAKKTIREHVDDKRPVMYSLKQLETGDTGDELWNAAQLEMVKTGKMHGYMRMYWAKKILEWTIDVKTAMKYAIYLNDKYELDGRDPNGYVGIAWSMGGVHDRAWGERPIFGKLRYMSYNGAKSKFNIKSYISNISNQ